MAKTTLEPPAWTPVAAATGYEVGLAGGRVVCRDAKGKRLAAVPAKLKDDDVVQDVRELATWLERHAAECRDTVTTWMLRSLPVPTGVLVAVWADDAWRAALRDLVVVSADGEPGFLRAADPARGLGVVTLDGETAHLAGTTVTIPHPVLLSELDDLREFAAELGVDQGTEQLFRQVHRRPDGASGTALHDYAEARFAQLRHVVGRARAAGFRVRGGFAVTVSWEAGRRTEAQVWIGEGDPASETELGSLMFSDADARTLPLSEVPPVAWSEGVRMAAHLHAGRVIAEDTSA